MNSRQKLHTVLYLAATECLDGKHGDGSERFHSLKMNGFSDSQIRRIQNIVNARITMMINNNLTQ